MSWKMVARWIASKHDAGEIKQVAERTRKHWEDVAQDVGYDPAKNVMLQEGEKETRVYVSEEMDQTFREEPGAWR